jgi:hypothetical protein
MKNRVIPAQITTVEDKIVGNLNLMQMVILMTPVFFTTLIYAMLPPSMSFVAYKLTLSAICFMICLVLSLRIKGRVVINWLSILLRYNLRAKYYIYDKNEAYLRDLYIPTLEIEKAVKKAPVKTKKTTPTTPIKEHIKNLVALENIVGSQDVEFRYRMDRKGGLNVAFEQIKK